MAWFQVSYFSPSLMRSVPLNVLLPAEYLGPIPGTESGAPVYPRFKTLYLLHGYMGNYNDWLHNTQINELSQEFGIAVVMPSGDNSFYVDQPRSGLRYGNFIGNELVSYTRSLFPLSDKREDTLIGGLSMGGYGAMRNALRYPEVFGHCIALSSAVPTDMVKTLTDEPNFLGVNRNYYRALFGDIDAMDGSDADAKALAKAIIDEGKPVPDLFFAVGYNDQLSSGNRALHEYFDEIGFKHTYEEGPGTHEWPFWRLFLRRGLTHALGSHDFTFQNPFFVNNYDPRYDVIGKPGEKGEI